MAKKKENKEEARPENGVEALREILEGAQGVNFEEWLPQNLPSYDAMPEIDKTLAKKKRNDWGNGIRLMTRYGENLIFVQNIGWFAWTGMQWSLDDGATMAHIYSQDTADQILGEVIATMAAGPHDDEAPKQFLQRIKAYYRFAFDSGNSNRISAMAREAAPRLRKKPEELNMDKYLLNLQNGTLNLKALDNGEENFDGIVLQEHKRIDRITKICNVSYDPNAEAPVFRKFMHEIMPDDDIRNFLQRFFGYSLTGETHEQIVLMLWGEGSNGKSTLMDLLTWLLGDYSLVTPFATLIHDERKRGSEASPDLARLPGSRFVSAAEPDTGSRISESIIKQLTGGEKIPVRKLHEEFFEFKPQFKLCLSFNTKPQIRGTDEGIWRRIALVPFTQSFVDAEQLPYRPGALPKVKNLDEQLQREASGILNWMLDGYRLWAENGLQIPDKVRNATSEYRQESNPVGLFFEAWCERAANGSVQATRLYEAYTIWCKENAFDPVTQTTFGRKMREMKIERETIRVVYYRGIQLTAAAENRLIEEETRKTRKRDNHDE